MLSRSIQKTADTLKEAWEQGDPLDRDIQLTLVRVMRQWQDMAALLETSAKPDLTPSPSGWTPQIVGGTEHGSEPDAREAKQHVLS